MIQYLGCVSYVEKYNFEFFLHKYIVVFVIYIYVYCILYLAYYICILYMYIQYIYCTCMYIVCCILQYIVYCILRVYCNFSNIFVYIIKLLIRKVYLKIIHKNYPVVLLLLFL